MNLPKPSNPDIIQLVRSAPIQGPAYPDRDMNNGKILKTSENLKALIEFMGVRCRYNMMLAEPEVIMEDNNQLGGSAVGQRSKLIDACQRFELPEKAIDDHLIALCEHNSYHPVKQWLEAGGEWDGKNRVDAAITMLNAQDNDYAQRVIKPWLVGCVAALYVDHFRSKLVPVLQGGQSFMKSAWVERIGSVITGSFVDCAINPEKTDDMRRALSGWIVELAELETTTRHEAGSLKAFITRDVDRFRVPYARDLTVKPRQTSFIATVNGTDFLKDQTGNTRFSVIEMSKPAEMDYLNALLGWSWHGGRLKLDDPEQLRQFWLEVKSMYDSGETWFLDDATLTQSAAVNDLHTDKGPIYAVIVERHLSLQNASLEWVTPSSLCRLHGERASMSGQYGRALKVLEREGLIEVREKRSKAKEYRLPIRMQDLINLN